MRKFDIVIDFDGVIVNTIKMFVELNNKVNNQNDDYLNVNDWDLKPCCKNLPTKADVDKFFNHKELYENPIFFRDCLNVINNLNSKYNIAICTIGQHDNIANKLKTIKNYLPNIVTLPIIVPVVDDFKKYNKDFIKTKIILDDHKRNLETNKADLKVLFEPNKRFKWNEGWEGEVALNWQHFEKICDDFLGKE